MSKSFDNVNVNVGDEFPYISRRSFGGWYLTTCEKHTVVRVTPKRFFTKTDEGGFHRLHVWLKNGKLISTEGQAVPLVPATDQKPEDPEAHYD